MSLDCGLWIVDCGLWMDGSIRIDLPLHSCDDRIHAGPPKVCYVDWGNDGWILVNLAFVTDWCEQQLLKANHRFWHQQQSMITIHQNKHTELWYNFDWKLFSLWQYCKELCTMECKNWMFSFISSSSLPINVQILIMILCDLTRLGECLKSMIWDHCAQIFLSICMKWYRSFWKFDDLFRSNGTDIQATMQCEFYACKLFSCSEFTTNT